MGSGRLIRRGAERGEIGLLAATLALAFGAAVAGVMIEVAAPAKAPPPSVFVQINGATGAHTADGIAIHVNYRAAVAPESSAPAPWTSSSTISCLASEQGGTGRTGTADSTVFVVPGSGRDDSMTIQISTGNPDAATFAITCDMSRDGKQFHAGPVPVSVAAATTSGGGASPGASPASTLDATRFRGSYHVTFMLTAGTDVDCGPSSVDAVIRVTVETGTRIHLDISSGAVAGASTGFSTDLSPTAQFSGQVPSLGLITGRFDERPDQQVYLTGTADSPDRHCTWKVQGFKR